MNAAEDSNARGEMYCPSCEKHFRTGDRCPDDNTRLVRLGARDPLVGRDLDGRYTITERIGQGGMGAVYRAHQHSVGRDVAVKVVNAHLVAETDVVKRFLREAKLASRLGHPNAVSVMDFGQTDDGVFYLVMELVSGRTLDVVLKDERMFRPERVVKIGVQICDALDAAHALSIVHRDLKPSNVMLLDGGRDLVKVLDFGLAKSVAPDQASTTMTGAGMVLGTPAFMPPELALGTACDGRADLYSLGCMLFLMGSGQLPFTSESVHELMAQHSTERAPSMRGVPDALGAVIDRLLEKAPAARYQTAAETRAALEASLTMISAPMRSILEPARAIVAGPGKPRSAAEMDQLISSTTELHESVPVAAPAATLAVVPRPRARWPWLVGALGAASVGVVVVVLATRSGDDAPPRTETRPVIMPVTAPPPPPEVHVAEPPSPPPIPPSIAKPEVAKPEVVKPEVVKPEVVKPEVVKKKPLPPHAKLPAGDPPAVGSAKPVAPTQPVITPPPAGSGAPKLPF